MVRLPAGQTDFLKVLPSLSYFPCMDMMTSSNGNIFRVIGHLCGESTGHRWIPRQWRGVLMFSLICAWIKGWVNNREAGDLRRHLAHYDITVMDILSYQHYHPPVIIKEKQRWDPAYQCYPLMRSARTEYAITKHQTTAGGIMLSIYSWPYADNCTVKQAKETLASWSLHALGDIRGRLLRNMIILY